MDNVIDSHITIVLLELLVHYYDSYGKKVGSFDSYCGYITNYLNGNVSTLPNVQRQTFDYLVGQVERQYGLPIDIAIELVIDLFIKCYWKNIYSYQHEMNRFLYNSDIY